MKRKHQGPNEKLKKSQLCSKTEHVYFGGNYFLNRKFLQKSTGITNTNILKSSVNNKHTYNSTNTKSLIKNN